MRRGQAGAIVSRKKQEKEKRFIKSRGNGRFTITYHHNSHTIFCRVLKTKSVWLEVTRRSMSNKKRAPKVVAGGLRQFSLTVCQKVESKGITSYNEVADETIAELLAAEQESKACIDEISVKNIRRRVYDALNVFTALDIITRDKKEIRWKGFPSSNGTYMQDKVLHDNLTANIGKKAAYLKDMESQIASLESFMLRNQKLFKEGSVPSKRIDLPFILVKANSCATVEIELSEDMQLIHFDFNSTPFLLHDDIDIVKLILHYEDPQDKPGLGKTSSPVISSQSF